MKTTSLLRTAFAVIALACFAGGQEPATEASRIAKTQVDAYLGAFNKGDAKALAAMYAEDAQYITDAGEVITGRPAILEGLIKFFAKNKGARLSIRTESARLITPDVLLEKGLATIDDETTRYTCTYIKKEGAWLISDLDEVTLPPLDAAEQSLGDLEWMVGNWKDNTPGITVETRVSWTMNKHFLRRSFTVTREGSDPLEGTEVIGFDPTSGQVRSWVFDSEGGFGEGLWKKDGDKWMISATSTAPDGTTSSAQHVITRLDEKKMTWESINREADGEALPNIDKIEVVRTGD